MNEYFFKRSSILTPIPPTAYLNYLLTSYSNYFKMPLVDLIFRLGRENLRVIPSNAAHYRLGTESLQIASTKSNSLRCQVSQKFLRWFLFPTLYMNLLPSV